MLAAIVSVLLTIAQTQTAAPKFPVSTDAPPHTIMGVVVDVTTAAPLADARVLLVEPSRAIQTAADGTFSFTNVAPGRYTIAVTTIGYIYVRRQIDLAADRGIALTIPLSEGTGTYRETVSVTADTTRPASLGVSSQSELGSAALQDLRGVLADDPMRAVQALPGVATGDDFQAQFSVRGVAFRQVGIVIDGTPASTLLHSIRGVNDSGSVAMINSDVLDRAFLFAGAHPQRDGDWLGATLTFDMRDGSRARTAARVAVSGTNASLVLEGPIGRGHRGSWVTSVRKSYIDWLIAKIDPTINSTVGFTDVQGKVNYDLSPSQRIEMTVVGGRSVYRDFDAGVTNGVANATSKSGLASIGWQFARRDLVLRQRVSITSNSFGNDGVQGQALGDGSLQTKIWRADLTWQRSRAWTFDAGARVAAEHDNRVLQHWVSIGGGRIRAGTLLPTEGTTRLSSLWGQGAYRTSRVGLSFGVRETADSLSGRSVASPWLLSEVIAGRFTFRASAGGSHQFPDLELLPLSTTRIAERARSVDLGIEHRLTNTLRWQVTAFARNDDDVIRALGEPQIVANTLVAETAFPSFASTLGGRTRGVDLLVGRRAMSGLTGWIAYTYAHTRYTDRLTGESFDGDFDQRHTLNVFLMQRLSYRTSVNAKLRMGSNFPIVGYFAGTPNALRLGTDRNTVRLPIYSRLDLRASRTFTFDRRRLTLFVEIMNALGRRNLGQFDGTIRSNFETSGYVDRMLPRVPSAGLLIEF